MPRVIPNEALHMNCDYAIVQAARVSFNQGLKDPGTDKKLINFLLKHGHTSPFEMVRFKFHVKAPLFVMRQWIRHRTANVNEISGRYSVLPSDFYVPKKLYEQGTFNKQSSGEIIKDKNTKELFDNYMNNSLNQYTMYKRLLNHGVSKEMARIALPLNMYTEFYWCIDLHNLLNFIRLRDAENAQGEIKEYAGAIKELIRDLCPFTIEAFDNHIKDSIKFSKKEYSTLVVYDRNRNSSRDLQNKINKMNDYSSEMNYFDSSCT